MTDSATHPSPDSVWRRRLLWCLVLGLALMVLLVAGLLHTQRGLALIISLANRTTPVAISYGELNGSLAHAAFTDLTIKLPDASLAADSLAVDWSPYGLLSGSLVVDNLESGDLIIFLGDADSQPQATSSTGLPQALTLPLDIHIHKLSVEQISWSTPEKSATEIRKLGLTARLTDQRWDLPELALTLVGSDPEGAATNATVSAKANLTPRFPFAHTLRMRVDGEVSGQNLSLNWNTAGSMERTAGAVRGQVNQQALTMEPVYAGFLDPHWQVGSNGTWGPWGVDLSAELNAHTLSAAELTLRHPGTADLGAGSITLTASGPYGALEGSLQGRLAASDRLAEITGRSSWQLGGLAAPPLTLTLSNLALTSPDGQINGAGNLVLSDPPQTALALSLNQLNLARLHPDLAALADGQIDVQTTMTDGSSVSRLTLDLASSGLTSNLTLRGELELTDLRPQRGNLVLLAGPDNQVQLNLHRPDRLQLNARLANLDALWPDLAGSISGQLQTHPAAVFKALSQPSMLAASWPPVLGTMSADNLTLGPLALDAARIELESQRVSLDLSGLTSDSSALQRGQLTMLGNPDNHQLDLTLVSPEGQLIASGVGQWQSPVYRLGLDQVGADVVDLPRLSNPQPWVMAFSPGRVSLSNSCLTADGASICLQGQQEADQLTGTLDLQLLDSALSRIQWRSWWPQMPDAMVVNGPILARATVAMEAQADRIEASIRLPGITLPPPQPGQDGAAGQPVQPFQNLQVDLRGNTTEAMLTASGLVAGGNLSVNGQLTDLLHSPQIQATARLQAQSLASLSAMLPSLSINGGPLDVGLNLDGDLVEPSVTGAASLTEMTVTLPELNIEPVISMQLELPDQAPGRFTGTLKSGEGSGTLSGQATLGPDRLIDVSLNGSQLLIADSEVLSLVASPDLQLTSSPDLTRLTGQVNIDDGLISLSTGPGGPRASPDVVVVDNPEAQARRPANASTMDVRVVIDDPVPVVGYGLKGELSGSLRVQQQPGGLMLGNGELLMSGTYGAFGQQLTIEAGRLNYVQTPLNDPAIDFFAYRQVGDTRVGVRVSGRVSSLSTRLESDPAMNESDQLAMLVLGERGNGLDESQSDQLASAALGLALARGNRQLSSLGESGVLPQVSLTQELGGLALAIGKQISPNLYVGYTVDLLEPVSLLRLRYRISDLWSAESELGQESRVAFRYRLEK